MADALALIAQRRREARIGTVVEVGTGGVATVDVDGGIFTAQLANHTATVSAGALVALLPLGDSWLVIASLSDGGAVGPVLGSNLVPNPGYEFGAPGSPPSNWSSYWTWGPAETTWDDTPGVSHSGNGATRVTLTPTADIPDANVSSPPVALDPGTNYRFSAWLRASSATSNLQMSLKAWSAPLAADAVPGGTGEASVVLATVTLPGAVWQEVYGTFTLPAGHHFASMFLKTIADAGADLTAWWDDAAIRQIITT
jgi:hypothetical protein